MNNIPIKFSQYIDTNGDGRINGVDYQGANNVQIKLLREFGILETTGDVSDSYLQLRYNNLDHKENIDELLNDAKQNKAKLEGREKPSIGIDNASDVNSSKNQNLNFVYDGTEGVCSAKTYDGTRIAIKYAKNNDGKYYYQVGDNWHALTSTNPQDVDKEVQEIVNKMVEPINKGFEEKEAKKPKPYNYKGVNITVREAQYKMNGDAVPPGTYNYYASIHGSTNWSTNKAELEAWIDEKMAGDISE